LGIQNNLKIRGSANKSGPRSSANKVQPNFFLPRWSSEDVLEIRMKSAGMMTINKHKHSICSEFFLVISVNPFWKVLRLGNSAWDFWGLIFGPGIFLGFVGSPRDFFGF